MEVSHPQSHFDEVFCEVFGHPLGEGCYQDTVMGSPLSNLGNEIIYLIGSGPDNHLRIYQTGGSDNLFHNLLTSVQFIGSRSGRDIDDLIDLSLEFFKF